MAERQPRVDPSDWASRRKHAMNRARELRSKMKDAEHHQGSDLASLSSMASKSELLRQRRSRQLEATQRLLDGQMGGLNFNEPSSGRSVGSKSYGEDRSRQKVTVSQEGYGESASAHGGSRRASTQRYNHDEHPVGRSGSHPRSVDSETHSIISQKHLGRIHKRYQTPLEADSPASKYDHPVSSARHNTEEVGFARTKEPKDAGNANKLASTSRALLSEDTIHQSLRDKPLEGRGRGRGRRKSPPDTSSSLGELSRSGKSFALRTPEEIKDQMADSSPSRSPSTKRAHSSRSSHPNEEDSEAVASYLRSRQVPDYKEGECEKLAILRQRLVARRRKRQYGSHDGKENAKPATGRSLERKNVARESNSQHGHDKQEGTVLKDKDEPRSLENLDPNDFSTKEFQIQHASPPRSHRHEPDDPRAHRREPSMDRSPLSYTRGKRGEDAIDDEASVVDIELVQCDCCKRSFAPKVYEKHFDDDGQPKCMTTHDKKRPVFNSAKARIENNDNLNKDEQLQVLQVNKKVSKELSRKMKGKSSKRRRDKSSKWREDSTSFREAMRANRLIAKAEREGKPAHYYL